MSFLYIFIVSLIELLLLYFNIIRSLILNERIIYFEVFQIVKLYLFITKKKPKLLYTWNFISLLIVIFLNITLFSIFENLICLDIFCFTDKNVYLLYFFYRKPSLSIRSKFYFYLLVEICFKFCAVNKCLLLKSVFN